MKLFLIVLTSAFAVATLVLGIAAVAGTQGLNNVLVGGLGITLALFVLLLALIQKKSANK